ncbi:hypothetical protein RO3G_00965 [Rhizopus delemar RA 99-880]|uniref:Uncharacterized protein n=1 Tax=Rhizopus delemar (strain RA 99-880 / ATCC MYA-4621 / FGSC 9543 / NRRL 43880) TaxID=246409 RepID=I1BJ81_RHIO9|nr:hypothetical protein RO3G_00965 [Rhizopus delemar RA 99-880]|eukprot:EIE76261.1 hypothetical protein RO3G_00965 [Rhizopus delemar RA 99-880]
MQFKGEYKEITSLSRIGLDREAVIMEISRTVTTHASNFKEAISICINNQAGIDEIS